ncbi:B12-binding domain-containing radical SAM protein [Chloroflexota bacterium]
MIEQLDLLLVNPGTRTQVYGGLGASLSGVEPPLWAALTAAFVRQHGYSVNILDAEAENLSSDSSADRIAGYAPLLTGIIVLGSNPSASSTPKMTAAGETAAALKRKAPDAKIIFGGLHPSSLPERTLNEEKVDFIAQGEGFYTILKLLHELKSGKKSGEYKIPGLWYRQNGKVISNPPAPLVNPDDLPIAAWDLLPMEKYRAHNWHCFDHISQRQPYAIIYTSLGCPYNCTYCNIHALYNNKPGIRFRSPEKVINEIDLLVKNYKIRNIKLMDELFAINEDHVIRLCDLIIERGYDLNIWAYARVNTVNERMVKKMKQAGVNWLCYGFESASQTVRNGVYKKTEQNVTDRAIKMTRAEGIYILANFMFGLPDDNMETMQETLDMAKGYNFEYVNFYMVMAYPGSQLYLDAVKQGLKLPESWHGYGQYSEEAIPMPTKYLSTNEVMRFRDNAFNNYFNNPEYLKMIKQKFGPEIVEHIKDMLTHKIHRKYT